MSGKPRVTPEQLARVIAKFREHSRLTFTEACRAIGENQATMRHRIERVVPRYATERPDLDFSLPMFGERGAVANVGAPDNAEIMRLRQEVRTLNATIAGYDKTFADEKWIKEKLFEFKAMPIAEPDWLVRPVKSSSSPGVPTLFASDWHWGEVVFPKQINGVNEYNMKIARGRAKALIERAVDLLNNHMVNPQYPGIVFALGGDMVSGDIHEELMATNEQEIMPVVVDLIGVLVWCIKTLADAFGFVFVPCVGGNHGRMTYKIRAKGRNFTSIDWLIYQMLRMQFENDERVQFFIPDGSDAHYKIYQHRYLLTHGDQFRGGDGVIGMLGPVIRGDHRKRSRNSQIDMEYDTMLMGHWHQLTQLQRLIVNGCFPAGSKVMTDLGNTPIEHVSIGDLVMSRDGTKQVVTHVFTKEADRLVGIKVTGLPEVVRATPNHLVWAIKRASATSDVPPSRRHLIDAPNGPAQWIPMDFLSPGDFVHVPFPKGDARPIDTETAWAYGMFLAEGSAILDAGASGKHNRIALTMHEREIQVLRRFAAWFNKTYGKEPRVFTRTRAGGGKTSELVVSPGREVCSAFRALFGHGAAGKHLPDGVLWWADDLKAALLHGWVDGDGHSAQQRDCRPTVSATTISERLAWGMFHITPACGAWPTLAKLSKGGRRKSDSYTVHLNVGQNVRVVNGEAFYQIAERFETAGNVPVFDLEVRGEHTYNVGGIGVHNSLKGYDEYAYTNNFPFEPARQGMWLTHPEHGITFSIPVFVDQKHKAAPSEWTSWK